MIQIICDENGNPEKVGYSQHYGGDKRSWNSDDVGKVNGTHPEVYVAEGGHASYFESGETDLAFGSGGTDHHEGNGDILNQSDYSIRQVTEKGWLNFRGRWGEQIDVTDLAKSPEGPVFRHTKDLKPEAYMWIEPMYWYSIL